MEEYREYAPWTDRVLSEAEEFGYRYIYDAYLLALNPQGLGLFFTMKARTSPGGQIAHYLESWQGTYSLLLDSPAARTAFADYLVTRFSPQTRNLEEWHNRQQRLRGGDAG